MSEIKDQAIQDFLNQLASQSATPGGGSAAAVMGAQSAALTSMVCNLTIGKPKYAAVENDMLVLLKQSEALRERFTAMIKADVEVFNRVMASYGMAKQTEEQKILRNAELQAALKEATEVPLACAKACAEAIALSKMAAEKGNVNVVTDAGVAVMSAYAAMKSAALNVYINIKSLKDTDFAEQSEKQLEAILSGAELETDEIYQLVKGKL